MKKPRYRCDGWTPTRRARFLARLRAGATITDAAAAVGMSRASAHRLRTRPGAEAFAADWAAASGIAASIGLADLQARLSALFPQDFIAPADPRTATTTGVGNRDAHVTFADATTAVGKRDAGVTFTQENGLENTVCACDACVIFGPRAAACENTAPA